MRPSGAGLERSLALDLVAGEESADPALRDVVGAGDLTLRGPGQHGGEDKTAFGHRSESKTDPILTLRHADDPTHTYSDVPRHPIPMSCARALPGAPSSLP